MAFRVFRFAVIKYKTKNLGVLNNVMFIGELGGSNRSWVSNTSRVSNRSRRKYSMMQSL